MALVETAEAGLRAARRGATAIQLRAPGLTSRRLFEEAVRLVAGLELPVVVSARADVALAAGAAGVHLPEHDLPAASARRLLGPERLVGRSVHSVAAAREAELEGADYAIFGPVLETPSHPGSPGLGWQALAEVASAVSIPVLGIGGLDPSSLPECRRAGAAGLAAIRGFGG